MLKCGCSEMMHGRPLLCNVCARKADIATARKLACHGCLQNMAHLPNYQARRDKMVLFWNRRENRMRVGGP